MRKGLATLLTLGALASAGCDKPQKNYDVEEPLSQSNYRGRGNTEERRQRWLSTRNFLDERANKELIGFGKIESLVKPDNFYPSGSFPNIIYTSNQGDYFLHGTSLFYQVDAETGQILTKGAHEITKTEESGIVLKLQNGNTVDIHPNRDELMNLRNGYSKDVEFKGVEEKEGKFFIKNWSGYKTTFDRENWEHL